jgi:non-specific serine/threonine protein kinase/serine/threonine-protein kinase
VTPDHWERIKELFASALEREPGDRSAFLRNACGPDEELRVELESLLASFDSDKSSQAGSAPSPDQPNTAAAAGQNIGHYRVIRQIGSGGMGAVYLAVRADDEYNKRVAIKLVQAGIDTQEILTRFRHERQILAALDHPNIAKLLDGGTTDQGLPYFVMDYVEGIRIDEYSDSHKLSIQERVALFRNVCSAVQYVHQNLVVHRDLKPGNILVTAESVPKLLDFGIARLMKPELFTNPLDATRVEFRLMTPGYASPEQVRGEPVTTASDVYSLGVILYELLTSRRPYQVKTDAPAEILRAVCDQEPARPSTAITRAENGDAGAREKKWTPELRAQMRGTVPEKLKRQLRGDLDTIVLKALRKEPQRRYVSAEQLSEDLRRHLEGLPVTAHGDSWSYRSSKFIGRHKAAVAAAALVLISLVAGVLATTWQARLARNERAEAQQQFNDVRRLTTSLLFEFHSAIQDLPGSTPARKLMVQRALEYLSKLAQHRTDAGLQRELAEAYLKVGDVQGNPYVPNLGDARGAAQSYGQALQISQSLAQADRKDWEARQYLARSYQALGEVLPVLGQPTEGITNLRHAGEIFEELAAAKPDSKELRQELAGCYQALGDLQGHGGRMNLGDSAGALESYRRGLAIYQAELTSDANDKAARRGVAVLQIRIGDLLMRDDLKAAMNKYRSALLTLQDLSANDLTNADARRLVAMGNQKVGGAQEELGDLKGALKSYDNAAAVREELMRADPSNALASMNFIVSLRYVGDLLYQMGDRAGALTKYQSAAVILDKLASAEPDNVEVQGRDSLMHIFVGQTLAEMGKPREARIATARGLAITRELAKRSDATPDELSEYADTFLTCEPADLRDLSAALEYAKESVAKSGGTDSENLDVLAQVYFQSGDVAHALDTEEKAASLLPPKNAEEPISSPRRRIEANLAKYKAAQKKSKP